MARKDLITAERAHQLLAYDPENGELRWRVKRGPRRAAALAGVVCKRSGYLLVRVDDILYPAHRLIWLMVTGHWPENDVDHKNTKRADNRWENLRAATRAENLQNQSLRSDNTSGFKGVSRDKNRWVARIREPNGGRYLYLGAYDDLQSAHAAYVAAAKAMFGEFARAA